VTQQAKPVRSRPPAISPTRAQDYPGWYQEVVRAADLAVMSHVRGSMVIKPWGWGIWEHLQRRLDDEIKARGHENCYFPVLIPLSYLQKEADHVEGFAKETAVVTHHRLEERDGRIVPAAPLTEPLVVRPTSETIIGVSMAEWITSYRDLPLLLNQWANVVRWELRPRILLRTTEFLWQEGHTAHATADEALAESLDIHQMYEDFVRDWLAMPVVAGEKPPSERFPGAENSFSIEAMMQDGKALQAGTSHFLGQNFARAQDIGFVDTDGQRKLAYTTSWGASTRLIGGVVMMHADDDGMVVPPRVAPHQVVIVPVLRGGDSDAEVLAYAEKVAGAVGAASDQDGDPVRVHLDRRQQRSADKRWQWTKRGAPVVVEVGPRDLADGVIAYRQRLDVDSVVRSDVSAFAAGVGDILGGLQSALLAQARARLEAGIVRGLHTLDEIRAHFESGGSGFVLGKWCGSPECEQALKGLAVTIRVLPQNLTADGDRCLIDGSPATTDALWAQAY
jgi:prolyl-tRNA synthetase